MTKAELVVLSKRAALLTGMWYAESEMMRKSKSEIERRWRALLALVVECRGKALDPTTNVRIEAFLREVGVQPNLYAA